MKKGKSLESVKPRIPKCPERLRKKGFYLHDRNARMKKGKTLESECSEWQIILDTLRTPLCCGLFLHFTDEDELI
eukprot:6490412-Amphidinium_carterae.1